MAKYMILYNSKISASDVMAQASPEDMKASMEEWIKWKDEASKALKVDFGTPLQAVSHITSAGTGDSDNKTSGYSIIESDSKENAVDLLKSHPHLKREGNSIDVLEMLSMPGM